MADISAKITAIVNALTAAPTPVAVTIYHDADATGYVDDDEHWTLADLSALLSQAPSILYPYGYDGGGYL